MTMRILVVTNQYPVEGRPSYGIFVAEQVRSLRAAGLQVDVLFFNTKKTRLNYALSLPRVIRTLRSGSYDLVHTHHTYSMILVDIARVLARRHIPVILTNHEGEVTDGSKRTRTWHPTSWLRHSLSVKRYAAERAEFVIFVSRETAGIVSPRRPYGIVPCGIDLGKFKPKDKEYCRRELGLPTDKVLIFFPAGPRAEGKWFSLAQAAYEIVRSRLPDAVLLTAGGIPHDSMPLYYNAADVVLQASFYEASPTVAKETLACEVPLVSTNSGDTQELVEGVPCCFVCGDDPAELAECVLRSIGHRASGGRQRLLFRGLGLDDVASTLIGIYQRVLHMDGARPEQLTEAPGRPMGETRT